MMKPVTKIALIAMLSALTFICQVALFFLPNIHLVTLLLILYVCLLPLSMSLAITLTFVTLNWLFWGFGDWVLGYYVIWPLFVVIAYSLRGYFQENQDYWAILAGGFGLAFGALFTIQHILLYGLHTGYAFWIRGLVFDIVHGVSNYIIVLLLFKPLLKIMKRLLSRLKKVQHA